MTKREYLESIGYENPYIVDDYDKNVYQKEILSKSTDEYFIIEINLNDLFDPSPFAELHFSINPIQVLLTVDSQEQIDELQEVYNIAKKDFEEMMKYED